jgi:DNA-directed RNA polymerase specialized sigma24 family protein
VLRRHFYNWIKAKSSDVIELPILNSHISDDIKEEIVNTISYEEKQPDVRDEKIVSAIETLPDKIKIIIKLHYFDFFKEEDLILVHNEFGGDFVEVIARYHDLKDKVTNRTDRKLSLQEKVNKAYLRIMRLEEIKGHQTGGNAVSEISDNITKIREKHIKALKKLKKSFMTLKNQDIAYLVGISAKNVANLLFRGKKMLRDSLSKIKIFM